MQLKIIFMGTSEFGAIVLEKLINSGYKPILIITAPDKPTGRKQIVTPPPVKISAIKYNIPVLQPEILANSKSEIINSKTDLIVVAAFGQIIPKEILEIPKYGCLNVHPSLLPRWRGPSPVQFTILSGDEKAGVTIMKITGKVDAGPIFAQKEVKLTGNEIYDILHNKLAQSGGDLLVEIIPKIIKGEIEPLSQNEASATYTKILRKEDGKIDWEKPAEEIERKIRAFNPWPGAFTAFRNKNLKILKAEISEKAGEKVLVIEKVQPEGKKPMSFEDFLRGYPDFKHPSVAKGGEERMFFDRRDSVK